MKKVSTWIWLLAALIPLSLTAQPWAEVSSSVSPNFYRMRTSADAALSTVRNQKGKGFKAFKRWENYWTQRVYPDGSFPPANLAQQQWEKYLAATLQSALLPGSAWTSQGPSTSTGGYAGIGRVNRISFHPTNSSIVFACTAGGGLWQTINGGSSWTPITDNLASIGTSGLVVHPTNPNILYLATGDGDGADTYSYGVLKSTDGGANWGTTGLVLGVGSVIYKLQAHATDPNIILAGTNGGLWRTADAGVTWTRVVSSGQFYDIEALPGSNIMVAVTKGGFYRSTDGGATWTLPLSLSGTGRMAIAVSPANSAFVAALVSNTSNGFYGFYASLDGGLTYTLRSSTPNLMGWETNGSDSGGQAWYDLCVAVSPTDVNQVFVGGVNTWKSSNGGVSWSIMTNWYPSGAIPTVHADHHDLVFQNNTTLWSANDGGVYRSTNSGGSWTDLSNGLVISQMYRTGVAQTDTRVIAGLQDNGTKVRNTSGTWTDEIGGDGMDCAIDPNNGAIMYGTLYYGDIQRSIDGGNSWISITPSSGNDGDWVTPFVLDPVTPSTLYLGYKELLKSTDRGNNWTPITSGLTGSRYISAIAVAPSNPQVIYISFGTSSLAKTTNGGSTWSLLTSPSNTTISSLAVNPSNPDQAYVTFANYTGGAKVYTTTNGGSSWTNISGTLPNLPANKLVFEQGSNGALYLGMDVGIYYRNNTLSDWSLYNSGLPNVEIFDLEIRYSDRKLIAATYGRGLWESPLYAGTPAQAPTVTSFSPVSAATGQTVTITGTQFTGVTAVRFGGTAATSYTVTSSTSLNAVVGSGTSGSVSVVTSGGTGSLAGFTYINNTPTLTSFSPTSARTGQSVTLTGTNFTGTTAVSFGGTAASSFTVVNSTSITAVVASGATGSVSVTTPNGTATLAGFTYLPPPVISSFSPTSAGTGQTITLTGTNFTGATAVSFGGTAATSFTVVSATSITAVVGSGTSGSVSVTTANGTGTRAGFTFVPTLSPPTLTSFSPTSARTGQSVTLTGTNFTGTTAISFGGTAASSFTVVSSTSITAVVASGATGSVSVTSPNGAATLAGFTYLPPPVISSFSPTSAGTGQTITLTGTNFTGATAVSFGGTAATSFTVVSATSITAVVGSGTSGSVSVTTANGTGTRAGFTFVPTLPPPTLTAFSPTFARSGDTVTLTGTNFTGATIVSFGGTTATSFNVVSSTTITAVVGNGSSGSVLVTTPNGTGTLTGFTFAPSLPNVTSFSPTSAGMGQTVTLTGSSFTGASAVSFGGTAATSFIVVSATSITAVVGSGTSGSVSVTTANGTGTRAGFTFVPTLSPPTLTTFSPTSARSGDTVTLTGTNFTGATIVSFGSTAAASFNVISSTTIKAVVGNGSTGSVLVTTPIGSVSLAGFTYLPLPVISSFSPTSARTGQTVTLTGTNFTGATAVSFGGIAASSFTVISSTSITAVVGNGTSGSISVINANGIGSLAGFTYLPPPTITNFSPSTAETGLTVTISGSNFNGATAVTFGGTAATSYTIVSSTIIKAVVGYGSTGSVRVTTANGTGTLAGFTYVSILPPPTISAFSPTSARAGQTVTLTGANFNGTTAVTFGGTAATSFTVLSSTSIAAVVGSGSTGAVSVTTPNGVGGQTGFTFLPPPILSSFSPSSAGSGQTVAITGTNLTGATAVRFGGTPAASFTVVSATSISAVVGSGSSGDVTVTTAGGTASLAGFLFLQAPSVSSFSPVSAGSGQTITISGANFTGTTSVRFGGTPATSFTVVSSTSIRAVVGSGSTGSVTVTAGTWSGSLSGFTFLPAPTVSSFSPTAAGTGQTVTITGTKLVGATAVSFGGTPATSFSVISSTSMTAVVGSGSTGSIIVTGPGGSGSRAGFTYLVNTITPTLTAFSPISAKPGQTVTLTGTNFTGTTAVSFGGTAAASFNVVSNTSITAVLGSGSSGSVMVTNPSGSSSLAGFTFIPAPVITKITPVRAVPGSTIVLNGSGFNANPLNNIVWIGATRAVVSATTSQSITATVPVGASTDYLRLLNTETQLVVQSSSFFTANSTPVRDSITQAHLAARLDLPTAVSPEDLRIADIDGDGKPDILVANQGAGSISVFRNTSVAGSLTASQFVRKDFSSGNGPTYIAVADLDHDGRPDVVVANQLENTLALFKNNSSTGNIQFLSPVKLTTGAAPLGVGIGDFDRNGWLDIIAINYDQNNISLFPNKGVFNSIGTGNFEARINLTTGLNPISIDVADLDGDNRADLVVGNYNSRTVSVFRNNHSTGALSASSFATRVDFSSGPNPGYIKLGDMDGDGKLDIVVLADAANSVSILRNQSTSGSLQGSSFAPRVNYNTGKTPYYIALGDMTGNGKLDILVTNYAAGTITLLQNRAVPGSLTASSFFKRLDFAVGINPFACMLADMDGDRKTDMLATNSGSNTLSIFRNIVPPIQALGGPIPTERPSSGTQLEPELEEIIPLTIFPNPTHGLVTVSVNLAYPEARAILLVRDNLGRLLRRFPDLGTGNHRVDLSDQVPGIYWFSLVDGEGTRLGENQVVVN